MKENHKNSKFKCLIRISKKNRDWIRKNNNGYTLAGKLDEIINNYKKNYANEKLR